MEMFWLVVSLTGLFLLAVLDILVWLYRGRDATLTYTIRRVSKDWPLLPFAVGFLFGVITGHLFWQ